MGTRSHRLLKRGAQAPGKASATVAAAAAARLRAQQAAIEQLDTDDADDAEGIGAFCQDFEGCDEDFGTEVAASSAGDGHQQLNLYSSYGFGSTFYSSGCGTAGSAPALNGSSGHALQDISVSSLLQQPLDESAIMHNGFYGSREEVEKLLAQAIQLRCRPRALAAQPSLQLRHLTPPSLQLQHPTPPPDPTTLQPAPPAPSSVVSTCVKGFASDLAEAWSNANKSVRFSPDSALEQAAAAATAAAAAAASVSGAEEAPNSERMLHMLLMDDELSEPQQMQQLSQTQQQDQNQQQQQQQHHQLHQQRQQNQQHRFKRQQTTRKAWMPARHPVTAAASTASAATASSMFLSAKPPVPKPRASCGGQGEAAIDEAASTPAPRPMPRARKGGGGGGGGGGSGGGGGGGGGGCGSGFEATPSPTPRSLTPVPKPRRPSGGLDWAPPVPRERHSVTPNAAEVYLDDDQEDEGVEAVAMAAAEFERRRLTEEDNATVRPEFLDGVLERLLQTRMQMTRRGVGGGEQLGAAASCSSLLPHHSAGSLAAAAAARRCDISSSLTTARRPMDTVLTVYGTAPGAGGAGGAGVVPGGGSAGRKTGAASCSVASGTRR